MTDVASARQGTPSTLAWPVRRPYTGDLVYLSAGQRHLLFWVQRRHRFSTVEASRVTGLDPSNVSRGLRRLASLALIGHRAYRGRNGFHVVWSIGRSRALTEAAGRLSWPTAKVATSTPFGGYLTRERWERAARAGERDAVRRPSPPRLLYDRCPAGHRVRLARFRTEHPGRDGRTMAGSWTGWCRRCRADVTHSLRVTLGRPVNHRDARLLRRRERSELFGAGSIDAATFHQLEAADPWPGWERVDMTPENAGPPGPVAREAAGPAFLHLAGDVT